MLEVGIKAPDFSLPDQNGQMRAISDYKVKAADNPAQMLGELG